MTPLSLLESADLLGRMRYVELELFERLGRRARQVDSAPVAVWLSGASLAHAFRAGLLEDHLPVSATLPGPDELTVSPGPGLDAALALLDPDPPQDADPDPEKGAGPADAELAEAVVGVLYPAMLAGYARRLALASPVADPPLARTLGRLLHDLRAVAEAGKDLPGVPAALARRPARTAGGRLAERLAAQLPTDGPFGTFGQGQSRLRVDKAQLGWPKRRRGPDKRA